MGKESFCDKVRFKFWASGALATGQFPTEYYPLSSLHTSGPPALNRYYFLPLSPSPPHFSPPPPPSFSLLPLGAAEGGGEAVARKSDKGDRPLPFWDTELRSLTADAREIPRALGDTFLVKAEARASRNVQEKPAGISMAPVDERSERRSPSGTNSHRFNSSPSPLIFEILSHVFDIINIGKTWERIRSALTYSGNSQSMATVTP